MACDVDCANKLDFPEEVELHHSLTTWTSSLAVVAPMKIDTVVGDERFSTLFETKLLESNIRRRSLLFMMQICDGQFSIIWFAYVTHDSQHSLYKVSDLFQILMIYFFGILKLGGFLLQHVKRRGILIKTYKLVAALAAVSVLFRSPLYSHCHVCLSLIIAYGIDPKMEHSLCIGSLQWA